DEGKVSSPLRVILLKCFQCFLTELHARLEKAMNTESALAGLLKLQRVQKSEMGVLQWNYFRYDAQTKTEQLNKDSMPVDAEDLLEQLQKAIRLLSADTLHRFHATRPLAENYESESISFLIQTSLRGKFLDQHLRVLSRCAVVFLMGAKIRPEKIHGSALAPRIAEMLR
ncbi:unnamed protein product, partial [Symbiodinium sp. CCMP2456]